MKNIPKTPDEDYRHKYLRALADYQNLEKQTQEWKRDFARFANVDLIKKLLEVLDDLEKAQEHINDEGLNLVLGKLKKTLQEEGLEEIEIEGREFDPKLAEAVSTGPGEENNKVTRVLQKGYKLKDKIIRVAKVTVATVIPSGAEGSH